MDAARVFARNAVKTRYEDIPPEALEATKKDVFDTLGCEVAGSSVSGARELAGMVKDWGGKEEATVLAFDCRVPAPNAAFANGAMARALDYNETYELGYTHAGISVVPAAFAMAESIGKVNGKQLLTALTLGIDLCCRMGAAARGRNAWIPPQRDGFYAAALTCGKLLNLDEERMVSALGIALAQTSGSRQSTEDRAMTRSMQGAFAAKGGLLSALMAQQGITGPENSMQGKYGFFNIHHGGDYDVAALMNKLGEWYEGANLSFKPYPSCRLAHTYIDAALEIRWKAGFNLKEIESICAVVNKDSRDLCEPLDICRNPQNLVQAQFSVPYVMAVALYQGKVTLGDFLGDGFREPKVRELAGKVTYKLDTSLNRKGMSPAIVEVKLRNGQILRSKQIDVARGHPENPMSMPEMVAKLRDCALFAAKPIPEKNVAEVVSLILELEKVPDAGRIMRLLA